MKIFTPDGLNDAQTRILNTGFFQSIIDETTTTLNRVNTALGNNTPPEDTDVMFLAGASSYLIEGVINESFDVEAILTEEQVQAAEALVNNIHIIELKNHEAIKATLEEGDLYNKFTANRNAFNVHIEARPEEGQIIDPAIAEARARIAQLDADAKNMREQLFDIMAESNDARDLVDVTGNSNVFLHMLETSTDEDLTALLVPNNDPESQLDVIRAAVLNLIATQAPQSEYKTVVGALTDAHNRIGAEIPSIDIMNYALRAASDDNSFNSAFNGMSAVLMQESIDIGFAFTNNPQIFASALTGKDSDFDVRDALMGMVDVSGLDKDRAFQMLSNASAEGGVLSPYADKIANFIAIENGDVVKHVAQAGEGLSHIAAQYPGVTWQEIQAFNDMGNSTDVEKGKVYLIPIAKPEPKSEDILVTDIAPEMGGVEITEQQDPILEQNGISPHTNRAEPPALETYNTDAADNKEMSIAIMANSPEVTIAPEEDPLVIGTSEIDVVTSLERPPQLISTTTSNEPIIDKQRPSQEAETIIPHEIVSGDTLEAISETYRVSIDEIMVANPQIESPDLIIAGETLNIPATTIATNNSTVLETPSSSPTRESFAAANATDQVHDRIRVLSGKTLSEIAPVKLYKQDRSEYMTMMGSQLQGSDHMQTRIAISSAIVAHFNGLESVDQIGAGSMLKIPTLEAASNILDSKNPQFLALLETTPQYASIKQSLEVAGITPANINEGPSTQAIRRI